jgi:hypothetical protein
MELEELSEASFPADADLAPLDGGWLDDGEGIVTCCRSDWPPALDAYEV